jgi:RNA polymerase sigma-70 factor, ECF subfamily
MTSGGLEETMSDERPTGAESSREAPPIERRVRELVAAGNAMGAATEALRAMGPELRGFLVGVLGREVDADQVFAATAERLWKSLDTFHWGCSLRAFLYGIARREIDRCRRDASSLAPARAATSEFLEMVVPRSPGPARRTALRRLLAEFPEDDRILVVLKVDRRMAWDELAVVFLDPDLCTDEERERESARLRWRFQLIKQRLAARAREEGLL